MGAEVKRRKLTYGTLPAEPRPGVALHCSSCQADYSARRADYFMHGAEPPTCGCGTKLVLVQVERRIIAV